MASKLPLAAQEGKYQHPPRKIRVLLVEDVRDQREMLERWLRESGYVTMSAKDGLEALELLQHHAFDAIVSDLNLPDLGALQFLGRLQERHPSAIVIFLSDQGMGEGMAAALREGRVHDLLQKPLLEFRRLNLAIEKALLSRQLDRPGSALFDSSTTRIPTEVLSARELELARLLVEGFETWAIADYLALSEKTVRNNLTQLYEKLGVGNRVQAILLCFQQRSF